MEASPQQQRRARNIVWSAAEDYQMEPQFLSFDRHGAANFYLNMVIGLAYKWLDWDSLSFLFRCMEGTPQETTYDGLLWLGLEEVVYQRELPQRPVLEWLRQEHSRSMMDSRAWLVETDRLVMLQTAWCQENLGQKPFLMPKDRRLLQELRFQGDWDSPRITQEFRRIVREHFKVSLPTEPPAAATRARGSLLQRLLRRRRQTPSPIFRARDLRLEEKGAGGREPPGRLWAGSSGRADAALRSQLERRFGPQVYPEETVRRLERELCVDTHRSCRLYFAAAPTDSQQYQLNRSHYQANKAVYDNALVQLRNRLKNQLTVQVPQDRIRSTSGRLQCSRVWRSQCLEDNRIFSKKIDFPEPAFSVDLLMDASHSQASRQMVLAAQGYIISESLSQCGIPVRVHAFNSFRNYTVLQRLRDYRQRDGSQQVFGYQAEGWNRDGLAIKALGRLMADSPHHNRILIILTDANPNDELAISLYQEYSGLDGIQDVAAQVQELRKGGVHVVAVFMGLDYHLETVGRIYGSNYVRISDPSQLAEAVASLIRRQLRSLA